MLFRSVIFAAGDIVKLSGVLTGGPNGLWRVHASYGIGDATYPLGRLELSPLQAQTPTAGTAGTPAAPIEIVRMDSVLADAGHPTAAGEPRGVSVDNGTGDTLRVTVRVVTIANPTYSYKTSHYNREPGDLFSVGSEVWLYGWNTVTGQPVDGLGTVSIVRKDQRNSNLADTVTRYTDIVVDLVGRTVSSTPFDTRGLSTSATNPPRVELYGVEGFLEPSPDQELVFYQGNETDGPDPDLEAIYGTANVHGYRGVSRFVLRKGNISNFGDRVPQFSGVVRASRNHTTHDVLRDVMRDAYGDDEASFDLSGLEPNSLLGYTQRGLQQGTTTIQPVAIAYGIEAQDIGGRWRLFKGADADLHVLEERELGAYRAGSGERRPKRFQHQPLQDKDMPRRLSLFYRDPLNDYTRTEKLARTANDEDPAGEDVVVDLDPLVLYPWDAQNAVNRLFAQALIGRDQGTINLPPSRCDILPNDRVTFTALNWNEETATIVSGSIDHTTQIGDIEVQSVSIEADFALAGRCRLVDRERYAGYGVGFFVGHPASVTPIVNFVDYATGAIQFVCGTEFVTSRATSAGTTTTLNDSGGGWSTNEHAGRKALIMSAGWEEVRESATITSNTATQLVFPAMSTAYGSGAFYMIADVDADSDSIVEASIRYEFPNPWRMRVQGQTCHRNRIFEQQLVAVAERFPVIGSPVEVNQPEVAVVARPAVLTTHILDIAGYTEQFIDRPGVFFAAAPRPGSVWRGAGVYVSTDDISFELLDQIEQPTTMGTAIDSLATADVGVVDWSQTLSVRLDYGTLDDATLDQIGSGSGQNWALYGDEILAFHSAVLETDGTYTLGGFVRGLRDTADAIGAHAAGERFVLLTNLGVPPISGAFHEWALRTDLGRSVYCKIVPTGGSLDDYDSEQVTWVGENVRPFAPASIVQGDLATYGYSVTLDPVGTYDATDWLTADVVVRWFRRSRAIAPAFGAGSAAPLLEATERYYLEVLRDSTVVRSEVIGGPNTGNLMVHRTFRYALADQVADGFSSGDVATFTVRQIGDGGVNKLSRASSISWTVP